MKRVCSVVLCGAVAVALVASLGVTPVQAFPEFKKEFDAKYVKDPANTPAETELAKAAAEAKCGICHTGPQGKNKKERNSYGKALGKLVKKGDKKDAPKIQEALEKVAAEHTDPADPASPTFGDLIKSGKLPTPSP